MSDLILGYGQIGQAVQEAVCPDAHIYDPKRRNGRGASPDVMHVCFPYSDKFVRQVNDYIIRYEPDYVAIWSTVPIGTTKKIKWKAIHTPIEGKHPKLASSIKLMTRWIGYNDKPTANFFLEYFNQRRIQTRIVKNTNHTEALKLLSTTEYGLNIAFADYKAYVAESLNMDYELTKQWNRDYNQLYKELGLRQFQKFILDAPNGFIGGHCIVPNAKLLGEQFPDDLVSKVIEMEEI
jgi:hypothetical protein